MDLDDQIQFNKQDDNRIRKRFLITVSIITAVVLVLMLVLIIKQPPKSSIIDTGRSALMKLYEKLEDEMTYIELTEKVEQIAPEATVVYNEGDYVISVEGADDYITCVVKENNVWSVTDGELFGNSSIIDEDDDLEGEADDGNELEDSEESTELYLVPEIAPDVIMTNFVYSIYNIADSFDNVSISKNLEGNGYIYDSGNDVMVFPNKSEAIDEYLITTYR